IGEWNDAINNDIMLFKTELIDQLIDCGIQNFVVIMENVLNFHADGDDYYQEWIEEIHGEIFLINALPHVLDELDRYHLYNQLSFGSRLNDIDWRKLKPDQIIELLETKFLES
ncbi:MAG: hypothetical protein P8I31_03370, partial [Bacteroidia bacterium]|nr:hypothetical protein [Bacteroidia bacterium]